MKGREAKAVRNDTKKIFRKLGPCSHTFFYVLNREFGHHRPAEERASDPLAGGINREGYQCGMLWGSTLAVGAEAYRQSEDKDQAVGTAITATQHLMESFESRTGSIDCEDITETDFSSKMSFAKYVLTGRFLACFKLSEQWTPEVIASARAGLEKGNADATQAPVSCASEVASRMGATDEQAVMVAGFAGGLGLSGNACGALAAAMWMKALAWGKTHPDKPSYPQPEAQKLIEAMYEETDYEILCEKICGRNFASIEEHSEFVRGGGCNTLMTALAELKQPGIDR